MVEIRDEKKYAIALASIQTIEYISTSDIKYVESKEVIHIRGAVIPLIRMDRELDFEPVEDDENLTVVIVQKGRQDSRTCYRQSDRSAGDRYQIS